MNKLAEVGRFFLAISMVAFGAQHFIYLDFVTRFFSKASGVDSRAFLPGLRLRLDPACRRRRDPA